MFTGELTTYSKRKLVLRADGSSQIGMGHIMRCLAINEMLNELFETKFCVYAPDNALINTLNSYNIIYNVLASQLDTEFAKDADAVIIDGYWFSNSYIKNLKLSTKIIQIDDLVSVEYFSDIVINHAVGANYSGAKVLPNTLILTGNQYALLRKVFFARRQIVTGRDAPEIITIAMGGADPVNNTLRVLRALWNVAKRPRIKIVLGQAYSSTNEMMAWLRQNQNENAELLRGLSAPEMLKLYTVTDLLICPASTTVYEAAAVGVPTICFKTADNQENMYKGLLTSNCVEGLGDIDLLNDTLLERLLEDAIKNYGSIVKKSHKQSELIDGNSPERIKKAILSLWN